MAFDFKFPDVGEGIHEGKIVKWLVKEGDSVAADQAIAEVETDKAVVEIPSPRAGKIEKLYHAVGDVMKVGEVMMTLEGAGVADAAGGETKVESTGVVGSLEPTSVGVMKAPTASGAVFGGGAAGAGAATTGTGAAPGVAPFGGAAIFGSGAVFTSADASTATAVTDAPTAGQKLCIDDIIFSVGATAMQVDFEIETAGTNFLTFYCTANSSY